MARRLIVSRRAAREVGQAFEWYEDQIPGLGYQFLAALDSQLKRIEESPLIYAEVHPRVRRALIRRFPYGVFYVLRHSVIAILAVVHTSRSPRRWPRG